MDEMAHSMKLVAKAAGNTPRESFRPLMHSLLSFGLVKKIEDADGSHHWELTPEAEERLDEVNASMGRPVATMAYLDHLCATCRQQKLTHLCEGRYLCVECERAQQQGQLPAEPNVRVQRRWERPLRSHKA
jgi:hypothetical protein